MSGHGMAFFHFYTDTVDVSAFQKELYGRKGQMRMLTDFHILRRGMRGQGGQMAFGHRGDKSGLML